MLQWEAQHQALKQDPKVEGQMGSRSCLKRDCSWELQGDNDLGQFLRRGWTLCSRAP